MSGERSIVDRFLDEVFEFDAKRFDDIDRALHEGWCGRDWARSGSNCFDLEIFFDRRVARIVDTLAHGDEGIIEVPLAELVDAMLRRRGVRREHPSLVTPPPRDDR